MIILKSLNSRRRFLNKQKLTINYLKRNIQDPIQPKYNVSDYVTGSTNASNTNSRKKLEGIIKKRPYSTSQNGPNTINNDNEPISSSYYKNARNMTNGLPSYYKNKLNIKPTKMKLHKNKKNPVSQSKYFYKYFYRAKY
jgi:hypothetical protein